MMTGRLERRQRRNHHPHAAAAAAAAAAIEENSYENDDNDLENDHRSCSSSSFRNNIEMDVVSSSSVMDVVLELPMTTNSAQRAGVGFGT
jgi:hypothetical protein